MNAAVPTTTLDVELTNKLNFWVKLEKVPNLSPEKFYYAGENSAEIEQQGHPAYHKMYRQIAIRA
jgi:hypothetical protein